MEKIFQSEVYPHPAHKKPQYREIQKYRLNRIREQLIKHDYAGALFVDTFNVRYATGTRNMQLWTIHKPARYVFIATNGPVILFEFKGCEHLINSDMPIDEVRPATSWFYFTSGPRVSERSDVWAAEIAALVKTHGGGNCRLAIDKLDPAGLFALSKVGVQIESGQEIAEQARAIKSEDEIIGLKRALGVCQIAFDKVCESLQPGISENEAWAIMGHANASLGGEYLETRLLTSGPRTNPWFQEAGTRKINAGDLVALDSDMIGPDGYFADMSRTFICGDERGTNQQRLIYSLALEQIQHNMALLAPGKSFRSIVENSWKIPERYKKNRYMSIIHGAGLCGEYPYLPYHQDFDAKGYDGVIKRNMTLCIESYIGPDDGPEGVKLEQLVLVTEDGTKVLSDYPFENRLL